LTKTTPFSLHDKRLMLDWATRLKTPTRQHKRKSTNQRVIPKFDANLPRSAQIFFKQALNELRQLPTAKQQNFVRLSLLSSGQSLLDCRREIPSVRCLKAKFCGDLERHIDEHYAFLTAAGKVSGIPRCKLKTFRRVRNLPSETLKETHLPKAWLPVKLVLTSPPYPGIHVLYHRWQINGRKESPAPFVIAGSLDGAGASYYTLGSRNEPNLRRYFENLERSFNGIRSVLDRRSLIIQLVAFSDPKWQLPAYLRAMGRAGYVELAAKCRNDFLSDGRLWRSVPGRRWYANAQGPLSSSREVLLFHRLA
jgi:hypothetical protein